MPKIMKQNRCPYTLEELRLMISNKIHQLWNTVNSSGLICIIAHNSTNVLSSKILSSS